MRRVYLIAAAAMILSWTGPAFTGLAHAAQPAAPIADQFKTEADAKAHCPGDQVVWANNSGKSKIYHAAGDKYYGTTKRGAFMCRKDSEAAGFRAAKPRYARAAKPA
jgi:hypothetical protein